MKLGRYEVIQEIGRGAMGIVYKGRDPMIQRTVALKTMEIAYDVPPAELEEFRRRFLREAQAAGKLSHPNVVTIYHVGENFLAMEYVEGEPLSDLIKRSAPLDISRSLHILEQLASVLDYAHERGVVHRDVKPANILIGPDDWVKVTDFGIAKILTASMTQSGKVLGTPRYMSPEQIGGERVDGRSDNFAAGVVAYELLTGQSPFPGRNITAVVLKILNETPIPPSRLRPDLSPGVDDVIMKALSKLRQDRYDSASVFCQDLGEAVHLDREETPPRETETSIKCAPSIEQVGAIPASDAHRGGRLVDAEGKLLTPLIFIVVAGPLVGERFLVKELPVTVGRGSSRQNQLELKDSSVSRRQATIDFSPEFSELVLINESSTNISATNDVRAYNPLPIRRGDRLTLGNSTLTVDLAE